MTQRHSIPRCIPTGKTSPRPLAGRRLALLCGVAALALSQVGPSAADTTITGTEGWSTAQSTSNAYFIGAPGGAAGTLTLTAGGNVTMNTTDNSIASRIEVGNNSTGTLNIQGGGVTFNIAPSASTGTAVGQFLIGGGLESAGGTGTLNLSAGSISFVSSVETSNFGRIAVGDGGGATGTVSQSGDTEISFGTFGQVDIGVNGGTGTYTLEGNAAFSADKGGSLHIGTGSGSNGTLTLSDFCAIHAGVERHGRIHTWRQRWNGCVHGLRRQGQHRVRPHHRKVHRLDRDTDPDGRRDLVHGWSEARIRRGHR